VTKKYRPGAIGAMTDEYEKALNELKSILIEIPETKFIKVIDSSVDPKFQSVKNIVSHIITAGYSYANYIRHRFGEKVSEINHSISNPREANDELNKMFIYTTETFEGKWHLTDSELLSTIIKTSWSTYDLEALIEHAIVHILRHRLQIQKLLEKGSN